MRLRTREIAAEGRYEEKTYPTVNVLLKATPFCCPITTSLRDGRTGGEEPPPGQPAGWPGGGSSPPVAQNFPGGWR